MLGFKMPLKCNSKTCKQWWGAAATCQLMSCIGGFTIIKKTGGKETKLHFFLVVRDWETPLKKSHTKISFTSAQKRLKVTTWACLRMTGLPLLQRNAVISFPVSLKKSVYYYITKDARSNHVICWVVTYSVTIQQESPLIIKYLALCSDPQLRWLPEWLLDGLVSLIFPNAVLQGCMYPEKHPTGPENCSFPDKTKEPSANSAQWNVRNALLEVTTNTREDSTGNTTQVLVCRRSRT